MKHIRKVMAVGLAIIFLIALVIGTGVILSVRNVNVSFIEYTGEYKEEYAATRKNFDKLKGSGLLFIDDADVYGKVTATDVLAVESYEKKFPCTVNIVLRERIETFNYSADAGYSVYDERGKLIRGGIEGEPTNTVDKCPNVLLRCAEGDIEGLAALCAEFNENFGALRRMVKSVETSKFPGLQLADINLYSGLKITVHDWKTSGAQKIRKAFELYSQLDEYQKTGGAIDVNSKGSAGFQASYAG
ncbi:MAG: hypothetical protein NC033_01205 [Clostridiales bacterium]|nr:hypothetical protein [Clostridiales bacterium]